MRTDETGKILEPCPTCTLRDCKCPCVTCQKAREDRMFGKEKK